jgi:hypothetical protein
VKITVLRVVVMILGLVNVVSGATLALMLSDGASVPWVPLLTFALPGIGQLLVVTIIGARMYQQQTTDHGELMLLRKRSHHQRNQITALLIRAKLDEMIDQEE